MWEYWLGKTEKLAASSTWGLLAWGVRRLFKRELKMNTLLKAALKELMDLVTVGKTAAAKNYTGLFTALLGAGEDVPAIVSNWGDLKPELQALVTNPASDADLLVYAAGLVGGESAKAQAVISASATLLLNGARDIEALVAALK